MGTIAMLQIAVWSEQHEASVSTVVETICMCMKPVWDRDKQLAGGMDVRMKRDTDSVGHEDANMSMGEGMDMGIVHTGMDTKMETLNDPVGQEECDHRYHRQNRTKTKQEIESYRFHHYPDRGCEVK